MRQSGLSRSVHILTRLTVPLNLSDSMCSGSISSSGLSTCSKGYRFRSSRVKICPVSHSLPSRNNFEPQFLSNVTTYPFILALNLEKNPSNVPLCPNMENFVLHSINSTPETSSVWQRIGLQGGRSSRRSRSPLWTDSFRRHRCWNNVMHVSYKLDGAAPT